ncbi:hypothetical protein K443DRAFT_15278 [Laccaria amethystina LaAM-08-1]|uniref:Unplaced genomic scaffold K443scaffold_664, whole genome shotgun sequence n=1 Tax=Laccaria amethystina LaAM-08-1 TaxID=1095629 RepID=A0A0C9WRB3_9AGAR|nr:hypothetical protein K443DRAFT_15278 [Laccaria amethystina LaAM-08-1]
MATVDGTIGRRGGPVCGIHKIVPTNHKPPAQCVFHTILKSSNWPFANLEANTICRKTALVNRTEDKQNQPLSHSA